MRICSLVLLTFFFTLNAKAAGICDRSSIVQYEIGMRSSNKPCQLISEEDLSSIEYLRIDFQGNNLKYADFKGLISLKGLEISNAIGDITEETFNDLVSLTDLRIEARGLPLLVTSDSKKKTSLNVHENAFLNLTNLKNLAVNSSALYFLSNDAFKGLNSLESLSFSNSFIWAEHFDFFFAHLTSLKELAITDVAALAKGFYTTSLFAGLSNLEILNLRNSATLTIVSFDGPIFKDLIALQDLDLSNNFFYSFSKDVFSKANFSSAAQVKMYHTCLYRIAGDYDPYLFKKQLGTRLQYESSCR